MKIFLIVPLGFEQLALKELQHWSNRIELDLQNIETTKGGIEFEAEAPRAYLLNYYLKIPSRILVRIKQFRCKDYKRLQQKVKNLPWRDFVGQGEINWVVSAQKSRVYNKKNIQQTCQQAYESFCKGSPAKKDSSKHSQKVFIRFDEDTCTISFDTSGEHLHKRGYKTHTSNAPLRENFSSGLLQLCLKHFPDNKAISLMDPMCGSGTFLGEAYLLNKGTQGLRSYSFENFKGFENADPLSVDSPFNSYSCFDLDAKAIEAAKYNLSNLGFENFQIQHKNCLDVKQKSDADLIIFNPPYGERIKVKDLKLSEFYLQIILHLFELHEPKILALLLPKGAVAKKAFAKLNLQIIEIFNFSNSGIPVEFAILKRK